MNMKKLLMAAIGGFVVMFLLSYLWHAVLMKEMYSGGGSPGHRAEPLIQFIALGYGVLACLMAYIYPKGVEGDNKLMNGIKFGSVMGLLWILPIMLVMYGVMEGMSLKHTAIDSAWHLVEQGIGGVIIAYVYGMKD